MNLIEAFNTALGSFGGFHHIRDEKSGIDTYFKNFNGTDVLVFYGSNEKADWITNFTFWFKKWKRPDYARSNSPIRVHSGYFDGWMRIREQVLDMVTSDTVLVTGNSQGGGLAPKELFCFDFAGPKVWNKAGRDSFNKRVPNAFPPFYSYSGKKVHIGNKEHWWKFSIKDHADMLNVGCIEAELRKTITF